MDTKEFYEYINGKQFIVTHEHRWNDGTREPVGRPAVGRITNVDIEKGTFTIKLYDYDENTYYECKYALPKYTDIYSYSRWNHCFGLTREFKGRSLIVRFWEA